MRGWILIGLLMASPLALANQGSWTSHSFGGIVSRGLQVTKSRPVAPTSPLPERAVATRLAWQITPDRYTPAGFTIKLCSGSRCLPLTGLRGEMRLPGNFPASGPFTFEYSVTERGMLAPPLTILRNQITVEYLIQK